MEPFSSQPDKDSRCFINPVCCLKWNKFVTRILTFTLYLKDLKDYMRQAGEVTYADAHKQRKNEG